MNDEHVAPLISHWNKRRENGKAEIFRFKQYFDKNAIHPAQYKPIPNTADLEELQEAVTKPRRKRRQPRKPARVAIPKRPRKSKGKGKSRAVVEDEDEEAEAEESQAEESEEDFIEVTALYSDREDDDDAETGDNDEEESSDDEYEEEWDEEWGGFDDNEEDASVDRNPAEDEEEEEDPAPDREPSTPAEMCAPSEVEKDQLSRTRFLSRLTDSVEFNFVVAYYGSIEVIRCVKFYPVNINNILI